MVVWALLAVARAIAPARLVFVSEDDSNDVVGLLSAAYPSGVVVKRSASEALSISRPGDTLLLLADGYPALQTAVDGSFWTAAARKLLRVFIEYPAAIPPYAKAGGNATYALKAWNALRPTAAANPTSYRGVLAPRLAPELAASWARAGLKPLDAFEHHAAASTMPRSWPEHAARYCHGVAPGQTPRVDCALERAATVHAYSTIFAGYDIANFGIDTLQPRVVPRPSDAPVGSVPLLYRPTAASGISWAAARCARRRPSSVRTSSAPSSPLSCVRRNSQNYDQRRNANGIKK